MTVTLALAGDTMLGRGVAGRLAADPGLELLAPAVREAAAAADLFVLNLECCISDRGARFPDPGKPFFFRAPPVAAQRLADLGVDGVTLANNHALDYGPEALLDTLAHLRDAGVAAAGAGPDVAAARAPMRLAGPGGERVRVVGASDHPAAFAATEDRPGIAYADLARGGVPDWLAAAAAPDRGAGEIVLVSPHWGPNMRSEPVAHVRAAAGALVDAGATLVAGHSAHVFQGVTGRVLHDLGDFVDDYAVDRALRNDLGFLWLVTLDAGGPRRLEALPLALGYARTDVARGGDATWALGRLRALSAALGTEVDVEAGRAVVRW
jgi:poly-gamma-glutamate capsule biosynthesis protein CapA/YwtB (metallophosphatase superfamily)